MQFFHIVTEKDMFRSSRRRCSVTKGVLRNFAKFTGKHLCPQGPATLLKKRLWHRSFPVNFAKFLRIPFVTEHLRPATLLKRTLAQVFCCEFSKNTFCYRTPAVPASVWCRRKVAGVKIEKLKGFIIKYYNISKTYSVQFHLFYLVSLSYFYFFIHGFQSLILHKLKSTLNCWLKLNKDNNRSFSVAYTTSIPASIK